MAYQARTGILFIADVSGYTEFLAHEELAHAEGIISKLLEAVITSAGAKLEVAKLEGDAVFFVGGQHEMGLQEFLEAIRTVFREFHACQAGVAAKNECRCRGCECAVKLGIKFVAHWGAFAEHRVHGFTELMGPDIILVHRLLKNSIEGREYAALTDALVRHWVQEALPEARRHVETYEHIGPVELWVLDLAGERATGSGSIAG